MQKYFASEYCEVFNDKEIVDVTQNVTFLSDFLVKDELNPKVVIKMKYKRITGKMLLAFLLIRNTCFISTHSQSMVLLVSFSHETPKYECQQQDP